MGSDPAAEHAPDPDEAPGPPGGVRAFRIGRTPVTNAEYAVFVDGHRSLGSVALAPRRDPRRAGSSTRSPTSPGTTPPRSAPGRAASSRPRPSGSAPRAAATGARGRGETSRRAPSMRPFARLADTAPVGAQPSRGRPLRRARPGGERLGVDDECAAARTPTTRGTGARTGRRGSRASSAAGPSSTAPARSAAPTATGCCRAPSTTTSASGSPLDRQPASGSTRDLVDVPAGEVLLGNDPRPSGGPALAARGAAAQVAVEAVELAATPVTNEDYARVRPARPGIRAPPHWPEGVMPAERRASPGHVRRLVRRRRLLPLGRRAPAHRGGVGEGRPRHRRAPLPVGRRRAAHADFVLNQHRVWPALRAAGDELC